MGICGLSMFLFLSSSFIAYFFVVSLFCCDFCRFCFLFFFDEFYLSLLLQFVCRLFYFLFCCLFIRLFSPFGGFLSYFLCRFLSFFFCLWIFSASLMVSSSLFFHASSIQLFLVYLPISNSNLSSFGYFNKQRFKYFHYSSKKV